MRTLAASLLVLAGISSSGCSDSSSGPGLGPDTTWQIGCATGSTSCGSLASDPHGPVQGEDPTAKNDDEPITVSCTKDSAGRLQIQIEDPGRPLADPKEPDVIKARARSILSITNATPSGNECFVAVQEYARTGTEYSLTENCTNSKVGDLSANCQFSGSYNSHGYAFEGTLQCPGMHLNNTLPADFKVGAAKNPDSPIQLQIVHCDGV